MPTVFLITFFFANDYQLIVSQSILNIVLPSIDLLCIRVMCLPVYSFYYLINRPFKVKFVLLFSYLDEENFSSQLDILLLPIILITRIYHLPFGNNVAKTFPIKRLSQIIHCGQYIVRRNHQPS